MKETKSFFNKILDWWKQLELFEKILLFIPFLIGIIIFGIWKIMPQEPIVTSPPSVEELKNYIKDNIKENTEKQKEVKKKIEKENINQEKIEKEILKIQKEIEDQIAKIDNIKDPTPDDFDKLFNSFRNRRN